MSSKDQLKAMLKQQAAEATKDTFSLAMEIDAELNSDLDGLNADFTKLNKQSSIKHRVPKVKVEESTPTNIDTYEPEISEFTAVGMGITEEESATTVTGMRGMTPKAPAATERFQKAKIKMLTQQVSEGVDVRKKMTEQMNDVQNQLKIEREENKKLRKRVQILETENRRNNNLKKNDKTGTDAKDIDALEQDVALLTKDLKTAERMVKQADAASKSKDLQYKRATETITRLKQQLQEAQTKNKGIEGGDSVKLDEAENRVRILEKQRGDLVDAFRKQMKLIDILKKQKVHIEAARLLNFTEEEFLKTLDWVN